METGLTHREKELVAVGASIAAGCRPCTSYHVEMARRAGVAEKEIRQAVDAALYVRETATEVMAGLADELLDAVSPANPSNGFEDTQIGRLVAVGAAFTVNCVTSFENHVRAGMRLGADRARIDGAIEVARAVKREAGKQMDACAGAPLNAADADQAGGGCCNQQKESAEGRRLAGKCGCDTTAIDTGGESESAPGPCGCG